jgi:hypothetical protein
MAIIPLIEKVVEFQIESGETVRAWRPYVVIELTGTGGIVFRKSAMVDSGAPFSVIPFSLWHDQHLAWQPLGSQFVRAGEPDPAALSWLGVPCQFGQTQVCLFDEQVGTRSARLHLRAKFPSAIVPSHAEKEVILGCNFLVENALTLTMRGGVGKLGGVFLTD